MPPEQYEAIRDSLIKKGKSRKEAKTIAAKIYNSLRDKKPSMPPLSNKPDGK